MSGAGSAGLALRPLSAGTSGAAGRGAGRPARASARVWRRLGHEPRTSSGSPAVTTLSTIRAVGVPGTTDDSAGRAGVEVGTLLGSRTPSARASGVEHRTR